MKEWTREEVERLVPESNTEHWERNMSFGYPAVLWDALLQTRLDLETARNALNRIEKWELPETGEYWDDEKKEPVSFTAQFGSNGARDFIRNIAREALKGHDK